MQELDHQNKINAFSANEATFQNSFGVWRQKIFQPLLVLIDKTCITPDMLSVLGILVMLLLPLGFLYSPAYLILAYLLHLFLDGIDGALARYKGISSQRGAYLDVVVDHASLVATVLTLQWFGLGGGLLVIAIHHLLSNFGCAFCADECARQSSDISCRSYKVPTLFTGGFNRFWIDTNDLA